MEKDEQTREQEELKEKMAEAYRVYQRNIRAVDPLVYEITKGARSGVPDKELLALAMKALDRCEYGEEQNGEGAAV